MSAIATQRETADAVSLTISEILRSDVLAAAEPEVMAGAAQLDRPVRWIHSSEIYEIAPLLSGGELLLTTGLGLAARSEDDRRRYVRELADGGQAGLALELGRTFGEVPGDMVDEAERRGLPLIALRAVVPFIRVTQTLNTRIVEQSSGQTRLGDEISRALNQALIEGAGPGSLLQTAAAVIRAPLVLLDATGAVVTAQGVPDEKAARTLAAVAEAPLTVHGSVWGRVLAGRGSTLSDDELGVALDRTAAALALCVLQAGRPPGDDERTASALLAELVDPTASGAPDVTLRAGLVGFHVTDSQTLVGVAVEAATAGGALLLIDRAARLLGATALRGWVRGTTLAVLAVPGAVTNPVGAVAQTLAEAARAVRDSPTCGVGHPVPAARGLAAVRPSLWDARAVLALSPAGDRAPVVTSVDAGLELLLTRHCGRDELLAMAERALAPLIRWDAERHTELVRTVEVHLRHGCSPTRTAAALTIGRQSCYQRLDRIAVLLGYQVDDPVHHAGLLVAAAAYRLAH